MFCSTITVVRYSTDHLLNLAKIKERKKIAWLVNLRDLCQIVFIQVADSIEFGGKNMKASIYKRSCSIHPLSRKRNL
jgi:hypothetical protein